MKTAGIIAEYNPLHDGHRYQIRTLREKAGADYIVVAMSGDFVQRGEPAVFDKYTRTAMALEAGADLVLELPARFAVSSAEDFASCGVALLDRIGVIDTLCFGSESGDLSALLLAAKVLLQEPEEFQTALRESLSRGNSYPKARAMALARYLEKQPEAAETMPGSGEILSSPNDILGIEYCKALLCRNSAIRPLPLRRQGQGYHEEILPEKDSGAYPSASALRRAYREQVLVPPEDCVPVYGDDLSLLLNARLLEIWHQGQDFDRFADVSPELASRISRSVLDFDTFSGRIAQLKTRQYTYTRVSRALLHILLGMEAGELADSRSQDYVSYARVLGFRQSAAPLLHEIKRRGDLPLVTKVADAPGLLSPRAMAMLRQDLYASHLYKSLVFQKSGKTIKNEYTRSVIVRP